MIPDETIAQIRDRADIVALVGEYVPLRRAGTSFKGLCPFHAEKTPSFHVNPQRHFFHCFGCGASGDVVRFLMQIEGIPFPEAARRLAERAGIEIAESDSHDDVEQRRAKERKQRLAAVMDSATGYFVSQLSRHPLSRMAQDAIAGRGVRPEIVEKFRLGYAPDGWNGLSDHLRGAGHSLDDAVELGLLVRNDRGNVFDRFRHRLMFPISDTHGQVVAFSGRILPDPPGAQPRSGDPPAKYINSPETPLYKKGDILYGLFEGRVALRREGTAILCEGNFDLVALHQAGFGTAVAPLGTAFTAEQAKLLRRYVDKVVLLFDGDSAGRKAIRAAYTILSVAGIAAQVVALPEGDDPDTFLRRDGAQALRDRIVNAPGAVAYFVDEAAVRAVADPGERARAIADLGPIVASVDGPVEKRLWIERIAQRFGVNDFEAVRRQLLSGVRSERDTRRGDARASEPSHTSPQRPQLPEKPGLAHELLGALLDHPKLLASDDAKRLAELLTREDLRVILLTSSRMYQDRGNLDGPSLVGAVEGSAAEGWLRERLAKSVYDEGGAERVLRDGIPRLEMHKLEHDMRRTKEQILDAQGRGNDKLANELRSSHALLVQQANELRKKRGNLTR